MIYKIRYIMTGSGQTDFRITDVELVNIGDLGLDPHNIMSLEDPDDGFVWGTMPYELARGGDVVHFNPECYTCGSEGALACNIFKGGKAYLLGKFIDKLD